MQTSPIPQRLHSNTELFMDLFLREEISWIQDILLKQNGPRYDYVAIRRFKA